jgi:hypothetical protein
MYHILLSEKGKVHNRELPASSYSKTKSDLLGKLASPLKKVVAEHFQKELPLDVS